ncbi:MAG: cobalamin-binding protein [Candidatus Binataceae bacterium]|nr:cobalamin-binding protein [Candidatus Binataceae bacterium]
MDSQARRIVSLLPSATEIVCALGLERELVGRSHECDYPPGVESRPILTAPRFEPIGSSFQIDRRVREVVSEALSVYHVDADLLRRLAPNYIVTQSQCEVCAVSEDEVERAIGNWSGIRPRIISLQAADLPGVWTDIERVGAALGVAERSFDVSRALKDRVRAIGENAAGANYRPGVICIEWIEPLMAAGNWVPEMVKIAGGRDLLGVVGQHSPRISFDDLCRANPDIIMVAPCGFAIEQTLSEMHTLTGDARWREIAAVANGRLFVADGNQYFNRPGPRIAESIEILAEMIHPSIFRFGHEGAGWQRV